MQLLIHWCIKQIRQYRKRQEDTESNELSIYVIEGSQTRSNQIQEAPSFDSVVFKSDGLPSYEEAIAYQRDNNSQQNGKTMQSSC